MKPEHRSAQVGVQARVGAHARCPGREARSGCSRARSPGDPRELGLGGAETRPPRGVVPRAPGFGRPRSARATSAVTWSRRGQGQIDVEREADEVAAEALLGHAHEGEGPAVHAHGPAEQRSSCPPKRRLPEGLADDHRRLRAPRIVVRGRAGGPGAASSRAGRRTRPRRAGRRPGCRCRFRVAARRPEASSPRRTHGPRRPRSPPAIGCAPGGRGRWAREKPEKASSSPRGRRGGSRGRALHPGQGTQQQRADHAEEAGGDAQGEAQGRPPRPG